MLSCFNNLHTLLQQSEAAAAELLAQEALIPPAEAAANRLVGQAAELDKEMAGLSNHRLATDADRVAALVAGAEVAQLPAGEIEASAARLRVLEGRRRQLGHDADAVRQHIATLQREAAAARKLLGKAEAAFATALGEAVLDAYQTAAVAFVETTLPELYSTAEFIQQKTGEKAERADRVLGGCTHAGAVLKRANVTRSCTMSSSASWSISGLARMRG